MMTEFNYPLKKDLILRKISLSLLEMPVSKIVPEVNSGCRSLYGFFSY